MRCNKGTFVCWGSNGKCVCVFGGGGVVQARWTGTLEEGEVCVATAEVLITHTAITGDPGILFS